MFELPYSAINTIKYTVCYLSTLTSKTIFFKKERGKKKKKVSGEIRRKTHVSIELAYKAGEITVLEILGKKILWELVRIPNDKAIATLTPRNDRVGLRVVHHLERLVQKRRWARLVQPHHRPRRRRTAHAIDDQTTTGLAISRLLLVVVLFAEDLHRFLFDLHRRRSRRGRRRRRAVLVVESVALLFGRRLRGEVGAGFAAPENGAVSELRAPRRRETRPGGGASSAAIRHRHHLLFRLLSEVLFAKAVLFGLENQSGERAIVIWLRKCERNEKCMLINLINFLNINNVMGFWWIYMSVISLCHVLEKESVYVCVYLRQRRWTDTFQWNVNEAKSFLQWWPLNYIVFGKLHSLLLFLAIYILNSKNLRNLYKLTSFVNFFLWNLPRELHVSFFLGVFVANE